MRPRGAKARPPCRRGVAAKQTERKEEEGPPGAHGPCCGVQEGLVRAPDAPWPLGSASPSEDPGPRAACLQGTCVCVGPRPQPPPGGSRWLWGPWGSPLTKASGAHCELRLVEEVDVQEKIVGDGNSGDLGGSGAASLGSRGHRRSPQGQVTPVPPPCPALVAGTRCSGRHSRRRCLPQVAPFPAPFLPRPQVTATNAFTGQSRSAPRKEGRCGGSWAAGAGPGGARPPAGLAASQPPERLPAAPPPGTTRRNGASTCPSYPAGLDSRGLRVRPEVGTWPVYRTKKKSPTGRPPYARSALLFALHNGGGHAGQLGRARPLPKCGRPALCGPSQDGPGTRCGSGALRPAAG